MDMPEALRSGAGPAARMKTTDGTMACSPEMDLLRACVRPDPAPLPSGTPVDWARFWGLATNHHVLPLVHRALKVAGSPAPPELLSGLSHRCREIAAHNLRAVGTLRRLQRLAEAEGIQLVPIKGPALAVLAHGCAALRQFEDLDILVRREDLLRAVEWLEREGYRLREIPPTADRRRHLATLQDWSLQRPGVVPHLDLKPVLISHALCGTPSADYLAAACRSWPTDDGGALSAPGPEAMLLAVCVDGANEMWPKLSSVADVAALLARFPDADWDELLRDAARLGQRRGVLVGAAVAEILLGCPCPAAFREGVRRDPAARRLAAEAARRIAAEESLSTGILRSSAFAFRTRDGWGGRARFVRRLLFVPGAADLQRIALPGALHPLYSCMRPFRLAGNAWRERPRRAPGGKAAQAH